MSFHRHLHAVPGGGSPDRATGNGRGRQAPSHDAVAPGVFTAQLHKGRARGPVRLQLVGELDMGVADEFRRAIDVAWALGSGSLLIDLRGLVFMDLTSVEVLLNAQRAAEQDGCRLAIVLGDAAARVLERAGVLSCFEVVPACPTG